MFSLSFLANLSRYMYYMFVAWLFVHKQCLRARLRVRDGSVRQAAAPLGGSGIMDRGQES